MNYYKQPTKFARSRNENIFSENSQDASGPIRDLVDRKSMSSVKFGDSPKGKNDKPKDDGKAKVNEIFQMQEVDLG